MQRSIVGRSISWVALTIALGLTTPLPAQVVPAGDVSGMVLADNVLMPQSRAMAFGRRGAVRITAVEVGVVVMEQAARTTIDVSMRNDDGAQQEAELLLPVPGGAVIRRFAFEGEAAEPTARLLPKLEAESTYHRIVAQVRDPALLEFVGTDLVRSSVFPVPAGGTQKVRLTYDHLLPRDGDRVDYVLPRSESVLYDVPWTIAVRIQAAHPISTLYSPSHDIETVRASDQRISARLTGDTTTEPGPFRLSYLLEGDGVTASLFAYPDAGGDSGSFLLLAGLPTARPDARAVTVPRELTLVLDRSGSMAGDKIEQARRAALQVLQGLDDGESFNVLVYSDQVSMFSPAPVVKDADSVARARRYLDAVRSGGGTNIHEALERVLAQEPVTGTLPLVMFLTDGLPTVGVTSEVVIRELAAEANPHGRRVFCFGVGYDVNAPLLDAVAAESRAVAEYVLPGEDVEVKVSAVFRRLSGPVLADTALRLLDAAGQPDPGRVLDLQPATIPDLFEGDQLVVMGRYVGDEPLHFALGGNYRGRVRTFRFDFDLDRATTDNAFVPRLWASRRIAALGDEIRQLGAEGSASLYASTSAGIHNSTAGLPHAQPWGSIRSGASWDRIIPAVDPRVAELVDEIVLLSTEYGILTEYTAFLALEGTDLSDRDEVMAVAMENFQTRAMDTRSGIGAVNQSFNRNFQIAQTRLNVRNEFVDARMNRVAVTDVQQLNDRAYFRRGERWVDSRLVNDGRADAPTSVIEFGSDEHVALVRRMAAEGRAGSVSLAGETVLLIDGEPVLVRGN